MGKFQKSSKTEFNSLIIAHKSNAIFEKIAFNAQQYRNKSEKYWIVAEVLIKIVMTSAQLTN